VVAKPCGFTHERAQTSNHSSNRSQESVANSPLRTTNESVQFHPGDEATLERYALMGCEGDRDETILLRTSSNSGESNNNHRGGLVNYLGSNTFGIGTPATYPLPQGPWGLSTPFMGSYAIGGVQPLQQVQQLLQLVPQQLQQVQYLQQLQAFHLQQLLQLVPTQLQLIQQLVQAVPQQLQQIQQMQQLQQPWQTSPIPAQSGFGLVPPGLASLSGAPVSHVM
jgi:hypothetical protein